MSPGKAIALGSSSNPAEGSDGVGTDGAPGSEGVGRDGALKDGSEKDGSEKPPPELVSVFGLAASGFFCPWNSCKQSVTVA